MNSTVQTDNLFGKKQIVSESFLSSNEEDSDEFNYFELNMDL
jgi:hypothetical protein